MTDLKFAACFLSTVDMKQKPETISYWAAESYKFTIYKQKAEDNIILETDEAKPLLLWAAASESSAACTK